MAYRTPDQPPVVATISLPISGCYDASILGKVRGELAVALASREAEVKSRDEAAARAQAELVAARDAQAQLTSQLWAWKQHGLLG